MTPPDPNDSENGCRRSPWLARLAVDARSGEVGLCCLLFCVHFLLLAFQYSSKSIRQSIFIDSLGAERLPFVYLLVAVCSYPLLVLYGRMVDRWAQGRLIAASSLLVAASMLGFWWLFRTFAGRDEWVSIAFYLWISIVGILLVSQFWSYSSQLLNARQAKRLFGFIGAGGILGSIAGGQVARLASRLHNTHATLLAAAVILVGVALAMRLGRTREARPTTAAERLRDARDGFSVVRGSPYLRLIAAVMLLSAIVAQVIDLQFSWVIQENTDTLDQRTAVFGNLYSIMGVAAFLFQMLATARIHRRLGVGFALRVLPSANALGTAVFLLAASFAPALLWPVAWLMKIGENGLRYSLDQATRELLFLPVADALRPKAKAFIDVFVQRLAKGVAAVALLSVTFGWVEVPATGWYSFAFIAIWMALLGATRRHYVATFREGLLRRDLEPEQKVDLADCATLEVLVEGLGSADPREVLHSVELLADHGRGRLVPPLMLHHGDPAVRRATLSVLRHAKRCDAIPLIEKLLGDPDPMVRAAATRTLAVLTPDDLHQLMLERLRDPELRIRAAAVSYLASHTDTEARRQANAALAEMLGDGAATVRLEAARALGELEEPLYQAGLVKLLYDSDPQVVRAAIAAVSSRVSRGGRNPLYNPILISHLHNRKLKHEARDALVAYGRDVVPALQHFMNDPQEEIWVRRALPKTLAGIRCRETVGALVEGLAAADPFLRRKVIEALGALHTASLELSPPASVIEAQIASECRGHQQAMVDLSSVGEVRRRRAVEPGVPAAANGGGPHLLELLLRDRMDDHTSNIFGLLALLYSPRDIRAAYHTMRSERPELRAHALEYLENLLDGEVRRLVFTVIDDLPPAERIRRAERLFHLATADADDALRRLASRRTPGDADAAWLTAAALHFIRDFDLPHLEGIIRDAARHDPEPLVQETTELLLGGEP